MLRVTDLTWTACGDVEAILGLVKVNNPTDRLYRRITIHKRYGTWDRIIIGLLGISLSLDRRRI